jgi:hypothetical protein
MGHKNGMSAIALQMEVNQTLHALKSNHRAIDALKVFLSDRRHERSLWSNMPPKSTEREVAAEKADNFEEAMDRMIAECWGMTPRAEYLLDIIDIFRKAVRHSKPTPDIRLQLDTDCHRPRWKYGRRASITPKPPHKSPLTRRKSNTYPRAIRGQD